MSKNNETLIKEGKIFAAVLTLMIVAGYVSGLVIYLSFKSFTLEAFQSLTVMGHIGIFFVGSLLLGCISLPIVLYMLKDVPDAPEDFYVPPKN